jgi:hypothetical protein
MEEAAAAATKLYNDKSTNGALRQALETAIAVAYARSFLASNEAGHLPKKWAAQPPHEKLHDDLLDLRNQRYAHNDPGGLREVVDAGALIGEPGTFAMQWVPMNVQAMPSVIAMAAKQQDRFRTRLAEIAAELEAD